MDIKANWPMIDPAALANFERYFEIFSRLLAVSFLLTIIVLLLIATRKTLADIFLGLTFFAWFVVMTYGQARAIAGIPPARIHWGVYLVVDIISATTIVLMVKEAGRIKRIAEQIQREKDRR